MLHYLGDQLALELGDAAKKYIPLYSKKGEEICKVAFFDLQKKKKRFVKFQLLMENWVFVDLVD